MIKKYIITYFLVVLGAIFLLFLVSLIPQSALEKGWENNQYTELGNLNLRSLVENDYATFVDEHTDTLMVDIAYRLNENGILSPIYHVEEIDNTINYGRYWHGYSVILRPLLLTTLNVRDIMRIVTIGLIILFFIQLIRKKMYMQTIILIIASYICNMWVTLFCLEYMPCVILSILISIILLSKDFTDRKSFGLLFFITGMIVQFIDFLTFETLTLTVPLVISEICYYKIYYTDYKIQDRLKQLMINCSSWIIGYALMFMTKCLLYIIDSGEIAINDIKYKIGQRILGDVTIYDSYTIKESIQLTTAMLKGFDFYNWKIFIIILLSCVSLSIVMMLCTKQRHFMFCTILCIIGLIPIVRFMLITEHSAAHFCFVYYALLSTCVVILYTILNTIIYYVDKIKNRS